MEKGSLQPFSYKLHIKSTLQWVIVYKKGNTMFYRYIIFICCFIAFSIQSPFEGQCVQKTSSENAIMMSDAQKTSDSEKWRLVYMEGGPYIDFPYILKETVNSMYAVGLIDNPYPHDIEDAKSTKQIWDWLSKNASGKYVEFVKDGFYSANWDKGKRAENKKALLDRINTKNDVDLIIAFGTGAGVDMATSEHSVPVFSMSVTDAVQAGIIASVEDSGLDHVHGQVELGRYKRQLSIFHEVFKFKKLGVPVLDTAEGEASVAYKDILDTAKNLDFEVVPCYMSFQSEGDEAFANLKQCIEKLSPNVDAMYMTLNQGMQWEKMPQLLAPIIKAEIPSFSQNGIVETKLGVLMSIAQTSFASKGIHAANAIKQLFEGVKPRDLGQVYEGPLGLALNLEMARLIGWNPPFEILVAVDVVYQKIYGVDSLK